MTIIGIKVKSREDNAIRVQNVLTSHGSIIKTRLGLHEGNQGGSDYGLILIELYPNAELAGIEKDLSSIPGIEVQHMVFQ